MATSFPNIAPDVSSTRSTKRTLNVTSFGNGYEQRVPVGINYKRDNWSLSWSNLTSDEKDTLVTFLEAISDGSVATWTSPMGGGEKKYVLDGDWGVSFPSGNLFTVTAKFRQVYDLV